MIAQRILKRAAILHKQVYTVLAGYAGKTVKASTLRVALNKKLGRQHGLIFRQSATPEAYGVVVEGMFEYTDSHRTTIDITLCYSIELIDMTASMIAELCVKLVQTIIHELTHREQHKSIRKRGSRARSISIATEYLANKHEIDAYANDVAYELFVTTKADLLRNGSKVSLGECLHLAVFFEHFNPTSDEYRRLIRKVYRNLSVLHSTFANVDIKTTTIR
jgi:hypothetical protein